MKKKYVKVLLDNDPILREKALKVDFPLTNKDKKILSSLLDYVVDSQDEELQKKYNLKPAVGLAAPQVGISKQLIAVCVQEEIKDEWVEYVYALANPKIISHSEQIAYLKNGEGCLSVEDEHIGFVPRYARIKVKAFDLITNEEIVIKASGFLSVVLQHEIDHLNGKLFYDRINTKQPWQEIAGAEVIE